jgi:AraC-like DNA-binding protein
MSACIRYNERSMEDIGSSGNRRHVLAAAATGFRDFMDQNGGGSDQLFSAVGFDEEQLNDVNLALDLSTYVEMMEKAAGQTGNDNFGLWYGQQFQPDMLGLIGGVAIASPTLGDAMTNLARLFPYHQQATATRFVTDGRMMRLEYRILDGSIVERRQDAELTLGMFVNIFRHCLGANWAPEEIHFEHLKPAGWQDHECAFSAPAYFGQRTNALIFRNEGMHWRMPHGDMRTLNRLRDQLMTIGRDAGVVSLLDRVKGEIRNQLPDGPPFIEVVADALGMPRWTLQRRLADYGFTYSEVVDVVRKNIAEQYVRRPYIPLVEIADLLGYSELSAFSRAFGRWFSVSPSQFRLIM